MKMCVAKYPRAPGNGWWGYTIMSPGRPRATRTVCTPPYDLGRGIRGPSMSGPWTVYAGTSWGNEDFATTSGSSSGHNFGLS